MKDSKLVWTSDPDAAKRLRESASGEIARDEEPAKQTIRVVIDRKRRAGKTMTLATGFALTPASLSALATALKKKCGAGGSGKEGEIEIQGEHVLIVGAELRTLGYRVK
ncbi:MAG TPA: translation initiation factor [Thermoanaerobaculia bacterium]